MILFRLSKNIYANELSGIGAAKCGGRWNSKGVEVIYVASNRSLALAELLVHLPLNLLPSNFKMISIYIPDSIAIKELSQYDFPLNWNCFPYNISTQKIGNIFVSENKFCLMKVPSAVTKGEYNYLINPFHNEFNKIKILEVEDFPFDNRMFNV